MWTPCHGEERGTGHQRWLLILSNCVFTLGVQLLSARTDKSCVRFIRPAIIQIIYIYVYIASMHSECIFTYSVFVAYTYMFMCEKVCPVFIYTICIYIIYLTWANMCLKSLCTGDNISLFSYAFYRKTIIYCVYACSKKILIYID